MIRLLNILILGAALTVPFAARAQDRRDQQPWSRTGIRPGRQPQPADQALLR
jgi:hypothetical protein